MSYVSSFTQFQQPTAAIAINKKEATAKILLFVSILACLALAVNM